MKGILVTALFILHVRVVLCFPWSWEKDPFMEGMTFDGCDFPVYDLSDPDVTVDFSLKFPFIARNVDLDWPAFQKWKKENFLSNYGANFVRSGSESSIVHSGGVAENETTLFDMVDSMSKVKEQVYGDSFIFDTTILRAIPELKEDFQVPSIFAAWDTPEKESTGALWHMLSLGPSRSGLPFHGHGKTWLTVVHGIKQWFVYPPGYDPPQSVDSSFNPMFPVSKWVQDVYPNLDGFSKPPRSFFPEASNASDHLVDTGERGHRPYECRQHAGDVMFLPRRWSHLTLNLGETIAIGGQETLYNEDRLSDATEVLLSRPDNFDAWRDAGLAQFNMATVALNSIRQNTRAYGPDGPTRIDGHPRQLDDLLARTQDSWVALYIDSSDPSFNSTALIDRWVHLNSALSDVANVAIVDLAGQYQVRGQDDVNAESDLAMVLADRARIVSSLQSGYRVLYVDATHTYETLPIVKMHKGDAKTPDANNPFVPDIAGRSLFEFRNPTDTAAIEITVREVMYEHSLAEGSIARVPTKQQREYNEALRNMKRALQIKPMQPELLCMAGEVAGLARDFRSLEEVVSNAVAILDRVNRTEMAPISLASTYHKLSHVYMKLRMWDRALPIMLKSAEMLPTFLPALSDIVYIHTMAGDRAAAEYALEVLKVVVPDTPKKLSDVDQLSAQIENIPWR